MRLKMKKPFPALCKDCKWSRKYSEGFGLRCYHPEVVAKNAWALSQSDAEGNAYGKDCREEREVRWPWGFCGMRGALWEPKDEYPPKPSPPPEPPAPKY